MFQDLERAEARHTEYQEEVMKAQEELEEKKNKSELPLVLPKGHEGTARDMGTTLRRT